MDNDLSIGNLLKDLGMRLGAAVAAVSLFFTVAFIRQIDLFGLGRLLDTDVAFFTAVFVLAAAVSAAWIVYRQAAA
jgi:hypothetical protein